jgi:signal peptidase I
MLKSPLNKARAVLQATYSWYLKKGDGIDPTLKYSLEQQMLTLEKDINSGNVNDATSDSNKLEELYNANCKKTFFDYAKELIFAVIIALILAVVVRQMWFEPYEIPTGSMRPTFREQDHVAVTKTPFGLNIPLTTGHLLFDPNLVQRTSAATFTSEDIDKLDEDTTFMWVIPYKKRLIKRLIGKPGDTLYFYGGKIYGVDSAGNPIEELLTTPSMSKLEHIPFMRFSGEMTSDGNNAITFSQSGTPIGKLTFTPARTLEGEIYSNGKWIKDDPAAQKSPHTEPKAYSDFFGIGNFAMARLLTKAEIKQFDDIDSSKLANGVLYLELRHHPNLTYPAPLLLKDLRLTPIINSLRTIIPLQQSHLDALMSHMYTARLVFKNGHATRYSVDKAHIGSDSPKFAGVPDGTYEYYDGKLKQVGWAAITYDVDANNPLYSHDPNNIQKLFNLGIEMNKAFEPLGAHQLYYPSRYAYFRDGDLYLLGGIVLSKDDPTLTAFNESEEKREKASSNEKPYIAFKDNGTPDLEKIKAFGLTIPEKQYYMLGDNHAMSADSRVFGFVPEANLQGAPSLILWPPGHRWGTPDQKPYPFMNMPRAIVWSIAAVALGIWWWLHRRYLHRPIILKNQQG